MDDTGTEVAVPSSVRRVVSLVPSLTETVAESAPGLLVGATDWCTHPVGLDVSRVRGTKNPDVPAILDLAPDVVLANEEENRRADIEQLRRIGTAVWVTRIESVSAALGSLDRMLRLACRVTRPGWLDEAESVWGEAYDGPARPPAVPGRRRAVVPIWRRPWMVLGRDTFAGDLLARLGVDNVFADDAERYPRVTLERIAAAGAELVVLPDEPYAFSATDGPESFPDTEIALVSGRHLTWYGPSLVEARTVLTRQLYASARPVR